MADVSFLTIHETSIAIISAHRVVRNTVRYSSINIGSTTPCGGR